MPHDVALRREETPQRRGLLRIEGWTFGGELRYHVLTTDPADVSIETGRTWPVSPTDVFF